MDDSRAAPLFTRIVGPSPETRAAEQAKQEWDERDRVRYRFFEQLLNRSSDYTNRFNSISPKARGNISASGGQGFSFNYTVRQDESRTFLFIDFKETQAVNDAAFAVFQKHRDEVESNVEYELEWVQDENRRRLIRHSVGVGYDDEDRWNEAHDELASVMAQPEAAVEPYMEEARKEAERKQREVERDG